MYHRLWKTLSAILIIGIFIQTADGNDIDIDESVLTAEEEELLHPSETVTSAPIEDQTINYESPYASPGKFHFAENFDKEEYFTRRWIMSTAKKDDIEESISKYDGVWSVEEPQRPILRGDLGMVLKSKAKHAAISSRLNKPFVFSDEPLIVQYEVQLQDGQECGGSYLKLLSSGKDTTDLKQFNDLTPYTIMFGPDKCGNDIKLHFIFRHTNPLNGSISEKHCRKPKERIEEPFKDKQPHLYQLIVKPDNTYIIRVDHKVVNEGSLLTDFTPAVNPEKHIDDVTDVKPADWDERAQINDPDASKPEDWDEDEPPQIPDTSTSKPDGWLDDVETMVPDPNAVKPEDWEPDMDGDWEAPLVANPLCEKAVGCGLWKAPMIPNPKYKGKWRAPLIDNPNYQGKWSPRKIPNPDFYEDLHPFKMATIAAVGIELWTMSADILFDNIIITSDEDAADEWASKTFDLKRKQIDKESETFVTRLINLTNENPWLWAVYVVVGGLPLAFLLYYCFSSSGKERPSDDPSQYKKTDEHVPDDIGEEASHTTSKSDLDKPVDEDEDEVIDEVEDSEEEVQEVEGDVEGDVEAEVEPAVTAAPNEPSEGVKKRRPRKD